MSGIETFAFPFEVVLTRADKREMDALRSSEKQSRHHAPITTIKTGVRVRSSWVCYPVLWAKFLGRVHVCTVEMLSENLTVFLIEASFRA